ncbi:urease accessory protein UreF [Spongisporangium articulatum]|uniref:Urease accessory protein UreF n=1 Tax=Spongisporangium articulatum TaxID=3362603 RepID=A0ABW8AGZ1_9ACTN
MLPTASASLLALADQRLPSGGHVHSGGIEQAITDGLVHDVGTLEAFLERRLLSQGLVTAGVAAEATRLASRAADPAGVVRALTVLDAETDARTPSPAQRAASRAQGRGLLRTARAAWAAPSAALNWTDLGARPHHPVVLGCAAAAAGDSPEAAALVAAYLAVSAPSTAAQRLLALDPVSVAAVTVRLGDAVETVAREAAHGLPDDSDPLLDLLAERHASREERLFAS